MKVRILGGLPDEQREELIALIQAAGHEVVVEDDESPDASCEESEPAVQDDTPSGDRDCEEIAVAVLHPRCGDDAAFEEAMRAAASRGCRVIGVWPPGSSGGAVPSAFDDYGSGTVPWEPGSVREAIGSADAGEPWLDPEGRPRPVQPMVRNKCR